MCVSCGRRLENAWFLCFAEWYKISYFSFLLLFPFSYMVPHLHLCLFLFCRRKGYLGFVLSTGHSVRALFLGNFSSFLIYPIFSFARFPCSPTKVLSQFFPLLSVGSGSMRNVPHHQASLFSLFCGLVLRYELHKFMFMMIDESWMFFPLTFPFC